MQKYIYQVDGEYRVLEASNIHQAMIDAACEGGVVIGNYTAFAHLFEE
jgi:hypothetical protein